MISNRSIRTRPTRVLFALAMVALSSVLLAAPSGVAQPPASSVVDYMEMEGAIDRVTFDFLRERIDQAGATGGDVLVVRLDSPGGLGVSPAEVSALLERSAVPVVVWIAPGAARAQGLAAHLALAADVLLMAPGARIGEADPFDLASDEGSERRLPEIAPGFSLSDRAIGSRDATRLEVADAVAASTPALLAGMAEMAADPSADRSLPKGPFQLRFHEMALLSRLMHSAARPVAAYLLLILGVFGIVFEMYNPGVGGAALFGGASLAFGLHALTVLPTRWYAAGLVAAGVGLFMADLRSGGMGRITAAGTVAFLSGSLGLFQGHPAVTLPRWAAAAGTAMVLLFFVSAMTAAVRARGARPLTGSESLVGTVGTARTDIAPSGQVMARGTLWRARTLGAAIAQGSEVEIRGVSGLMLIVEPSPGSADEGS